LTALPDQADAVSPPTVRLVLIMDTQPNLAQAQGEVIFTDMGAATQALHSYLAMGAGTGGRFKILADEFYPFECYSMNDAAATGSINGTVPEYSFTHQFKKPIEVQIKASGSTPATSQLSNCNIFMLAKADGVFTIGLNGVARAYYVD